jgi:transcriptional regulator with XRE-family HTH domain
MKKFGDRIRQLRKAKGLGQRALAKEVGISLTYVSKIENHRLDFGDYPSTDVILRIAVALEANEDELLILAEKIPERIRQRVLERPDAFSRLAELDDRELDRVLREMGNERGNPPNPVDRGELMTGGGK